MSSQDPYPKFDDPWTTYAICDRSENGIYVYPVGNINEDSGKLCKYNFATKSWSPPIRLPNSLEGRYISHMIRSEQGGLLFLSLSGSYPDIRYHLNSYHPASQTFSDVPFPLEEDIFDKNLFCEANGKIFISYAFGDENNKLYAFDTKKKDWEELCDLPRDFAEDHMSAAWNENKLYLFCSSDWPTDWPDFIYVYDTTTCQISKEATIKDPTHQWPSDMGMYVMASYKDAAYFFGIFDGFDLPSPLTKNENKKIHRLHLPSLTWSELPFNLPNSKLQFVPIIKHNGETILCYEGFMHRINLSNEPRLLQNICWDFIVDYPRRQPLSTYSDEALLNCGIHKNFIFKLRW